MMLDRSVLTQADCIISVVSPRLTPQPTAWLTSHELVRYLSHRPIARAFLGIPAASRRATIVVHTNCSLPRLFACGPGSYSKALLRKCPAEDRRAPATALTRAVK
eukprot:COSAG02_NODE_4302_length_5530_cov_15.301970_6_plen_105_part_00